MSSGEDGAGDAPDDRYRIIRRLGSGGAATVHLAEDVRLGRPVAIKRLHAESPDDAVRRFRREARVGAAFTHPNMVTIYDAHSDGESVVIVMEYVEGETLQRTIERGPMAPAEALEILRPVAAALDTAHEHGVVHRDVKPANILLGGKGRVKLTDFGIASAAEATRITQVGSMLGTLAYMAPEQLAGEDVSPAADVYSLAAVAFEMLTGRKARAGENAFEILRRAETDPPPELRDDLPDAPLAAADALKRGLAREPAERPRTAGALVEALARAFAAPAPAVADEEAEAPAAAARPEPAPPPAAAAPVAAEPPTPEPPRRPRPATPPPRERAPAPIPASRGRSSRGRALAAAAVLAALVILAIVLLSSGGSGSGSGSGQRAAGTTGTAKTKTRTKTTSTGAGATGGQSTTGAGAGTTTPPAAAGGAGAGTSAPQTPTDTVRAFYERAAAGQFEQSYALLAPAFKAKFGSFAEFKRELGTLRSIRFDSLKTVEQTSTTAVVSLQSVATHTTRVDHCHGELALVRDSSSSPWLVNPRSVSCASS